MSNVFNAANTNVAIPMLTPPGDRRDPRKKPVSVRMVLTCVILAYSAAMFAMTTMAYQIGRANGYFAGHVAGYTQRMSEEGTKS